MNDYKSNSHKARTESSDLKKIEKVVTGNVKRRKPSEVKKLTDVFISEDVSKVKSYVVMDVLIPAIKKAISDIITDGIAMILYGDSGRTKTSSTSASKISYRNYNEISSQNQRPYRTNTSYSYDEITLDTRGEAELVLMQMDEIINTYGLVSVGDFYDLVGVTGDYTANEYGWTNIDQASISRVPGGYYIKLPKAFPINKN